jgi:hypothetical protein
MMPILIAFDGAAAALVDEELLLLPPHAAIQSPHSASPAIAASRRSGQRLMSLSNLATSSVTFVI